MNHDASCTCKPCMVHFWEQVQENDRKRFITPVPGQATSIGLMAYAREWILPDVVPGDEIRITMVGEKGGLKLGVHLDCGDWQDVRTSFFPIGGLSPVEAQTRLERHLRWEVESILGEETAPPKREILIPPGRDILTFEKVSLSEKKPGAGEAIGFDKKPPLLCGRFGDPQASANESVDLGWPYTVYD